MKKKNYVLNSKINELAVTAKLGCWCSDNLADKKWYQDDELEGMQMQLLAQYRGLT